MLNGELNLARSSENGVPEEVELLSRDIFQPMIFRYFLSASKRQVDWKISIRLKNIYIHISRFDVNSHSNTIQNVLPTTDGSISDILYKYNVIYYFNFVLEGSAMLPCDYSNPFQVSIFKNKKVKFPWFNFANFWIDAGQTLIFRLNYRNPSEPLTVFEIFPLDICLMAFVR